jgi:mono/diheme cytochrome c family protein
LRLIVVPRWAALGFAAALIAGCGGGDGDAPETVTAPRTVAATAPPAHGPIAVGRRVFEQSGCFACHQIGTRGKSGPGNNLSGIGERRTPAQLHRALVDARAPMPSYSTLPRRERVAVVAYLSALRGGPGCVTGSDCG